MVWSLPGAAAAIAEAQVASDIAPCNNASICAIKVQTVDGSSQRTWCRMKLSHSSTSCRSKVTRPNLSKASRQGGPIGHGRFAGRCGSLLRAICGKAGSRLVGGRRETNGWVTFQVVKCLSFPPHPT